MSMATPGLLGAVLLYIGDVTQQLGACCPSLSVRMPFTQQVTPETIPGLLSQCARAETFPARTPHGTGPSILDPYLAYLERRLAEGCVKWPRSLARAARAGLPGWNPAGPPMADRATVGSGQDRAARPAHQGGGQSTAARGTRCSTSPAHGAPTRVAAGPACCGPGSRRCSNSRPRRAGQGGCDRRQTGAPLHGPCTRLRRCRPAGRPRPSRPGR